MDADTLKQADLNNWSVDLSGVIRDENGDEVSFDELQEAAAEITVTVTKFLERIKAMIAATK